MKTRVTQFQEDTMTTWTWYHRLGAAVLIPLLVASGPLAAAPTEKYDPIRQISVQAVPANLLITLDRSGSMALDRYGNGFIRGVGADGAYFTADDVFGSDRGLNVPYGSPMIDTWGLPPLRNPSDGDGYAFAGGVLPAKIPGENSTGKLRWKAAEPMECETGSGLYGLYYGDGGGSSGFWQLPGLNTDPSTLGKAPIATRIDGTVNFVQDWTLAQLTFDVTVVPVAVEPVAVERVVVVHEVRSTTDRRAARPRWA